MERPKRRKHKDNPYTLEKLGNGKYIVSFKDGTNKFNEIEITEEVFNVMNKFELDDLSELNEFDNHIEHSEIFEDKLNIRAVDKPISLEDIVENKIDIELLKDAINTLPDIQKKRIKLYFLEDKTLDEIAKIDNCSKVAIKYSIDVALNSLRKKIKK